MDYKETSYEVVGFDKYCIYCGKKMKWETEWDEYTKFQSYYCNCKDAKKEWEINQQIEKLKKQLPKRNDKIINKLHKKYEIECIEAKYN